MLLRLIISGALLGAIRDRLALARVDYLFVQNDACCSGS
jgi:hypothetical protein